MNIEQLADCYRDGWTLNDLGAQIGVSESTVRARLIKHGVEMRATGNIKGRSTQADRLDFDDLERVLPLEAVRASLIRDAARHGFDDVVEFLR